jgi:hypothetical protein
LAIPPTTEDAFLREVDDELRRDELTNFGKRWGRLLGGAIIGGLAVFAAYLWWQHDNTQKGEAAGESYDAALKDATDNKFKDANTKFDAMKSTSSDGYRASAMLTKAAIALEQQDIKGAAAIYGQVAKDESYAKPWRDLALVRQTATEFDTMKPEDVIARMKPLAVKGNPWFGSAGEMVAVSYLQLGKKELAGKIFGDMAKDETVPETIRSRAVQMAGALGVDAVEPTREAKTK